MEIKTNLDLTPYNPNALVEERVEEILSYEGTPGDYFRDNHPPFNFSKRLSGWYCNRAIDSNPGTIQEEIEKLKEALKKQGEECSWRSRDKPKVALVIKGLEEMGAEAERVFSPYQHESIMYPRPRGGDDFSCIAELCRLGITPLDPVTTLRKLYMRGGGTNAFTGGDQCSHTLGTIWIGEDERPKFLKYHEVYGGGSFHVSVTGKLHIGEFSLEQNSEENRTDGIFGRKIRKTE
ncbi:hypothetical protein HN832_02710 [archaeon]|jgi:hypothetical protein|nr:hypothetical protein [archaeon]MBT4373266.1 hypothetical protein [archaeon]MBT4531611.1 hypothetical protein [archaeon]MBT7001211.1 hypothetical protein [archaeon]MBT7282303.1 hypothetical protein [archaeon]